MYRVGWLNTCIVIKRNLLTSDHDMAKAAASRTTNEHSGMKNPGKMLKSIAAIRRFSIGQSDLSYSSYSNLATTIAWKSNNSRFFYDYECMAVSTSPHGRIGAVCQSSWSRNAIPYNRNEASESTDTFSKHGRSASEVGGQNATDSRQLLNCIFTVGITPSKKSTFSFKKPPKHLNTDKNNWSLRNT